MTDPWEGIRPGQGRTLRAASADSDTPRMIAPRRRSRPSSLRPLVLLTLVALGAGLACGGANDKEVGGTEGDYEEVLGAVRPLIQAQCDWYFSCCDAREQLYALGGAVTDAAGCVERVEELLRASTTQNPIPNAGFNVGVARFFAYLAYDLDEGRVRLDADGLAACEAELRADACNPVLQGGDGERCTPPPLPTGDSACQISNLMIGQQGEGEYCLVGSVECAEGYFCSGVGTEGRCIPGVAEGTACFADYQCPTDLVCDWESQRCIRGAGPGEACSYRDPENPTPDTELLRCAEGLACDPVSSTCAGTECAPGASCNEDEQCPEGLFCVAGRCGPLGAVGDDCWNDEDCDESYCDWNTNTCAPAGANGSECDDHRECTSGYCAYDSNAGVYACAASVAPGQECPDYNDDQCAGGWCDTSVAPPVCVAVGGAGASCTSTNQCNTDADLVCSDGSCKKVPFANGEPCTADSQCVSDICFELSCVAGGAAGDDCDVTGTLAPCATGFFCMLEPDAEMGTCKALGGAGAPCTSGLECWGNCTVRYGHQICSAGGEQPGTAYCDGM